MLIYQGVQDLFLQKNGVATAAKSELYGKEIISIPTYAWNKPVNDLL